MLSVCSWHAWWLFNQSTQQPAILSRFEPALRSTCNVLQHQVGDMNMQHRACHLGAWVSEQETLQVKKLRRQLYDPMLQVQLCLPHARAVLVHTDRQILLVKEVRRIVRGQTMYGSDAWLMPKALLQAARVISGQRNVPEVQLILEHAGVTDTVRLPVLPAIAERALALVIASLSMPEC